MPRGRIAGLVAIIAIAACARVALTWRVFSQTVDEPIHVAAGQQWLHEGRYDLDVEHPPLARVLFALPFHDVAVEGDRVSRGNQLYWRDGRYLANLALSRAGNLPFLLLTLLVVFFWTRRLAGDAAGLIAAALIACLPPVLAHAGLATTDMAAAATTIAALYALANWMEDPSWPRTAILGVAAGVGLLTKFSFLLYFAAGALILLLCRDGRPRPSSTAGPRPRAAVSALIALLIALLLVMAAYRFHRGSLLEARAEQFVPGSHEHRAATYAKVPGYEWVRPDLIERFHRDAATAERAGLSGIDFVDWAKAAGYPSPLAGRSGRDTMAGAPPLERRPLTEPLRAAWQKYVLRAHLPAYEYILGAEYVRLHSAMGHGEAWLFDRNEPDGYWYYFPVLILFKTPLPFLILAIAGLCFLPRRALALFLIPLVFLGVAMTSRINIGVRHVLPLYPFLAIAAAYGAVMLWPRSRALVAILGAWLLVGTTLAHPDYLAWFNELAGRHPERIAADSNLDWGQDLLRLARAVGTEPVHIAYFGSADVSRHIPRAQPVPPHCTPGLVAVSEMLYLRQREGDLRWIARFEPERRVGASIRLYRIPEAACR